MNMELWNKVKKRFEDHPGCVDMGFYSNTYDPSCMTVGCKFFVPARAVLAAMNAFERGEF